MATFHLKRFSQPGTLKKIDRRLLLRFLAPYREYFKSRGLELPTAAGLGGLDFDGLVEVLMSPDVDTPDDLANALYFVHEMATPEGMDELLEDTKAEDLGVDEDSTPAEVAIAVWLRNRDLLERKHAERSLIRPRSFEYYQSEQLAPRRLKAPSRETLAALEADLDDWFESKLRGRGCRVFVFPKGGEMWFLVRHGDPFKREPSLKDGQPSSVFYRPEKNDVVIYSPHLGELRMNASSKGEKDLYCAKFGLHVFGSEEYFPGRGKYTLEPLRQGPSSIVCSDIEGLDWVVLKELQWVWHGPYLEVETRRAKDLFAAFEARNGRIPDKPRLQGAKFEVKFTSAKRPRTVTVRPSNIAQYTRDPDSVLIEQWLSRRGFSKAANAAA